MAKTDTDIAIPAPTLERHSLFHVNGPAVQRWVDRLPKANVGETTRQIYRALKELNRVDCAAADRLAALEKIRPVTHSVQKGMQRYYLNQPIVLPAKARRVTELADFLNRQMALGYTLAAAGTTDGNGSRLANDDLTRALHRALTEHSRFLLRRYQLYSDPTPELWRSLHRLYHLALSRQVTGGEVEDRLFGSCAVQQCYLRPLMLATAQPHQLSQKDLEKVFDHLAQWDRKLVLKAGDISACTFVFHPTDDTPPAYRQCREAMQGMLGIDTHSLCKHLSGLVKHARDHAEVLVGGDDIDTHLLEHLHTAWSEMSERASARVERRGAIKVALGLQSTHFFVADRTAFRQFAGEDYREDVTGNPFMREARDVWSRAPERDPFEKDEHEPPQGDDIETIDFTSPFARDDDEKSTDAHRLYEVELVNASQLGYCIQWPSSAAVKLKTGNIVALSEPRAPRWSVGVLRWVKKMDENVSHVGVEVLGVTAEPYSARALQSGLPDGAPQRAFLLPPDTATGTPGRALLPRTAFKPGQSVELQQPTQRIRIQLTDRTMSTRLLSLFDYKLQETGTTFEKEQEKASGDGIEFDSLWNQL